MFAGNPYEQRNYYRLGIQKIPLSLYELEVPVVAAVNGPAIGAGLDLACMCDVRIASKTAAFAESFVKLGIIPGDGGAWLLPRIRSEEHTSELQSLMRISYAVFCLKKKNKHNTTIEIIHQELSYAPLPI